MATTNGQPDDPQLHGRSPAEPHTPDQPSEERAHSEALGWATLGLTAAFGATGVALSLTGHEGAGIALLSACSLGRGVSRK
ncbi:hypothetical protein ACFTZI_11105 [Streptomyces decoyicus]|uniref:hypothetical protein n=1 Tax=Streptomyces decoyicus TaxID=249567 RepID=UPI00362D6034